MSAPGIVLLLQPSQARLRLTPISPEHHLLQCHGNVLCFQVFSDQKV